MIEYFYLFSKGIAVTILAWAITGLLSLLIGSFLGIISCNYLGYSKIRYLTKLYTFIAKGIPAYVQILIAYFIIPQLIGLNIPAFACACGALAFCSSGYVTEIIRSGINSIHLGQWQACVTLGYPLQATLRRIILPQTFKNIGPALFGEFEQLLKSTSLLATIGITELTRTGMNIISRTLNPIPVYLTIACIYLLCAALLNLLSMYAEKRTSYGQN
ncbi:MAG: amino acid ABC transporter permease [Candidatus Babeliales bacterium]|nr:amino acid ABC transporter permease [Candidatus Babeliales bacterium]